MTLLPDLDQSIQKIKSIRSDTNQHGSLKLVSEVYLGAVGLLHHLKTDQLTLLRIGKQAADDKKTPNYPPPNEVPAMSAVIHDVQLFLALVRCLSSTAGGTVPDNDGSTNERVGRKRSLSFNTSDPNASKLLKLSHSPVPTARKVMGDNGLQSGPKKPTFSVAALAATILYTAIQYLDHWPANLVKAYADDKFGPRLWVDDSRCRLLVQNLALVHSASTDHTGEKESPATPQVLIDAARVVETYRDLTWTDEAPRHSSSSSVVRRGSMSSTGSSHVIPKRTASMDSLDHSSQNLDSDSGEEEEHIVTTALGDRGRNGNSSSPGDGGESVVINGTKKKRQKTEVGRGTSETEKRKGVEEFPRFYPLKQMSLNLTRVRRRFFGANGELAQFLISTSLHDRLDLKSKQNSGLLQSLPEFASIPKVRSLIASNLTKWLQSPALAGLARALFSATVNHIENADPPMPDDLMAIDSILSMRLKANQLNAHIQNVTAIARRIPTAAVARHMYSKLLRDELECTSGRSGSSDSNYLKMVGAIHKALPPQISYDALASALLLMLVKPFESEGRTGRDSLISKLRRILRLIAAEFAPSFDGCQLIESFVSLDVSSGTWSPRDDEDKARLMLQCITLAVAPYAKRKAKGLEKVEESELRESLMSAKKMLLTWCCTDYGPRCSGRLRKRKAGKKGDALAGAGVPNFKSALLVSVEEKIPSWLNTMRCLLFIEDIDSDLLEKFALPGGITGDDESDWEIEASRINLCCTYGGDITDEMLWIVLKSSTPSGGGLEPEMSVQLLENMFERCGRKRQGVLRVSDPMLVWELYNIVQYSPSLGQNDDPVTPDGQETKPSGVTKQEIARLAYPDLWWRVTVLALVMCGSSCGIGAEMWKEHPTLRGLVKMVTSMRYRFPTVDCDEPCREEMKKAEQRARDEESRIAELLFLPPKQVAKKVRKVGSRMSRRLLKQQQEKEAARELAEKSRRKKMLRAAQKSIMLWDPDGPARKPPREVADLLLSVEALFELSDAFQRSEEPDYLSMTIGSTTRAAVERAYDWLIPVISRLPETIVRLESSTSCFLLLRAYGTDGEERKQLKELAAPLLRHVRESLKGLFGLNDSVKAFELLMSDVASQSPDRRRCARRVLRDALTMESPGSWMISYLQLDHATSLVSDAVKYMAIAAGYERGSVLRSLIIALKDSITFAEKNNVDVKRRFPCLLVELISRRPNVYAEGVDAFLDLRSIAVSVVYDEFARFAGGGENSTCSDAESTIDITLHKNPFSGANRVKIPVPAIRSTAVLLSVWKEEYSRYEKDAAERVDKLVSSLMRTDSVESETELDNAERLPEKWDAIPVELWIMLAKARSDSIARRAALSAPATFLPRLLLCSGLPRASLLTMIDRLGQLGESSVDGMNKTYLQLLEPSASSQWDIGRLGRKQDISRKLLGRLSAYLQLHGVAVTGEKPEVSTTFLRWLSSTCSQSETKPKKTKQKKFKVPSDSCLKSFTAASSLLADFVPRDVLCEEDNGAAVKQAEESYDWMTRNEDAGSEAVIAGSDSNKAAIAELLNANDALAIDGKLCSILGEKASDATELASHLLTLFVLLPNAQTDVVACVLKWVPRLSLTRGSTSLWKQLFSKELSAPLASNLVAKCTKVWSRKHLQMCKEWICDVFETRKNELDSERIAEFLASTCPISALSLTPGPSPDANGLGDSMVRCFISVSAECLQQFTTIHENLDFGRHSLLAGFELGMVAGSQGKAYFQSVCDMSIELIGMNGNGSIFEALLLRLYLRHPAWMNLGLEKVRSLLMSASESFAEEWVCWRSSLDDHLEETVDSLSCGYLRLTKSLADISRKHPLIMLRKALLIVAALDSDADVTCRREDEIRGMVHGLAVAEPRFAKFMDKVVKVKVRHWGYSYSEPVWLAFLDAIASAPREVLFGCGLRIGLLDILFVYLKLIYVQQQLLTAEKSKRLRTKLTEIFEMFQLQNPGGWRSWLGSVVEGSEVRHVLMSCGFITAQQAIESLRQTPNKAPG